MNPKVEHNEKCSCSAEVTQDNLVSLLKTWYWKAEICSDFNWTLTFTMLLTGHATSFWILAALSFLTDLVLAKKTLDLEKKLDL